MNISDNPGATIRHWLPAIATAGIVILIISHYNQALLIGLNNLGREHNWLWANITSLGDAIVAIAVLALFARRYPTIIAAALLAAIIGTLVIHGLKGLTQAPRPPAVLGEALNIIGPAHKAGSFPSGHSATAFTLATIVLLGMKLRWWWQGALIMGSAAVIALSRCIVGVHWPLDVIVGSLIGATAATLCIYWARRWQWAASLPGQRILTLLPIVACLLLPFYDTGYPQAKPLHAMISLTILTLSWRQLWLLYLPWHYPLTRHLTDP